MSGTHRTNGSLLTPETRSRVKRLGEPIAMFFGRAGLTPNALTLIGFAITVVAGVLAGLGLWLAAGIVVIVGGVFDMFDGTLARATGRVSKVGAFLDSVFDRWGEAVVYVGIVVGCVSVDFGPGAVLAALAMASAFLVSYVRAKAEGLGFSPGTGMAEVGLAPREIRLVIMAVGLVLTGLAGGISFLTDGVCGYAVVCDPAAIARWSNGALTLAGTLGIISILATITVIQRIIHVRQQAVGSDGK